jgi:hypothetical protein
VAKQACQDAGIDTRLYRVRRVSVPHLSCPGAGLRLPSLLARTSA